MLLVLSELRSQQLLEKKKRKEDSFIFFQGNYCIDFLGVSIYQPVLISYYGSFSFKELALLKNYDFWYKT